MQAAIHVLPGASRARVGGFRDGALVVRVTEHPIAGQATIAALAAVARALGVPKRDVTLIRGHSSRIKIIEIPDSAAIAFAALA